MAKDGERFRKLGDELARLTNGRHYFSGVQESPTMYLFSFGAFHSPVDAQAELDRRLNNARSGVQED